MIRTKKVKQKPSQSLTLALFITLILLITLTVFDIRQPLNTLLNTLVYKKLDNISHNQVEKNSTQSAKLSQTPSEEPKYSGFCLKVPILLYHHIESLEEAKKNGHATLAVSPEIFEQQMRYLIQIGYKTISVNELANTLINKKGFPSKTLVLTFDDGYKDFYTTAYPILYKYHLVGNLMIPTGLLGNSGYLNWDELKRMVDTGLISAYDHTWSHANLGSLSEEKTRNEILTAKKQLEEKLGKIVNIFAYPYGSENQRIINLLKENGFVAALSTFPGSTQCDSFIMTLHRTRIGNAPLTKYGL